MKLLLDTHVWIWSLREPERLGSATRSTLVSETTELFLSPISVWELLLLVERGRVAVPSDPQVWVKRLLRDLPFREAPLTFEVALASRELQLDHQDPADRFLAATAIVGKMTLVTADERLLSCAEVETLSAA